MVEEVRLWSIEGGNNLREIPRTRLDLEARLETWLEHDISVLDPNLLVIGRQVETDFGGFIDLLCIDQANGEDLQERDLNRFENLPIAISARAGGKRLNRGDGGRPCVQPARFMPLSGDWAITQGRPYG